MRPPRNLPNLITGSRLVLAVVLITLLSLIETARGAGVAQGSLWQAIADNERLLLNLGLGIFVTAAISDVLDGHIARRWGLTTDFGRIVDPFADKVIVCGTFVQLVPLEGSRVESWMVVLILARELLVDGLRGFAEAKGVAFPAMASGKAKMFSQSVAVGWILFTMANLGGVSWSGALVTALLWTVVVVTLYSGVVYVLHARKVLGAETLAAETSGGR